MLNNALRPLPGDACFRQSRLALSAQDSQKSPESAPQWRWPSTGRHHAQAHSNIPGDSIPIWRRKAFACSILNSDRSRRGISVEVGSLEALIGVAVTVDSYQLTHAAPPRMIAFAVQDKINGFCCFRAHESVVQIGTCAEGQIREPIEGVQRRFRVNSGQRAAVSRIHCLEQVVAAFVADLAHDDAVGPVAKRSRQKLAGRDGNLARNRIDCLPADGVWMQHLQLGWLLDNQEAFVLGNVVKERLHQGCLPRSGPAADDAVLTLTNETYDSISNVLRHTARCNQFVGAVPAVELSDGKGWPIDRRRRADHGYTRAVRQAGIQNRILRCEVLSKHTGDPLDCGLEPIVGIGGFKRNLLHYAVTIGIDSRGAVNHQIGDGRIKQKRPQLVGKEWENQFVTHRGAPVAGCGIAG